MQRPLPNRSKSLSMNFWLLCLLTAASAAPSHAVAPDKLAALLAQHGSPTGAVDAAASLDDAHPLTRALAGKQLRKVRDTVPGAPAFYFSSDTQTIVVVTATPDMVDGYVLPSIRGGQWFSLDGSPRETNALVDAPLTFLTSALG